MKKILSIFLTVGLLFIGIVPTDAVKRHANPLDCPWAGHSTCDGKDNNDDGLIDNNSISHAFEAVTDGYGVHVKDCQASTYNSIGDGQEQSLSGFYLAKPDSTEGVRAKFQPGTAVCSGTFTADTYYVWVRIRAKVTPSNRESVLWWDLNPFLPPFDNGRAGYLSGLTTSFAWIGPLPYGLDFATIDTTQTHTNDPGTISLGTNSTIYFTADGNLEIDAMFVSTNVAATPLAPAVGEGGAGGSGGAAGTNVSSLEWTQVVTAGDLITVGVCHRTSTDTITSVTSSIDGALTQVGTNNDAANPSVRGALYRFSNASVGTHTITVSFSEAQNAAAGSAVYAGVDTSLPFLTTLVANAGAGQDPSTVLSSEDSTRTIIDHLCTSAVDSAVVTAGANQTQKWSFSVGIEALSNRQSASSLETGDGNITMSWTGMGGAAWIQQVVELNKLSALSLSTADLNWSFAQGGGGAPTGFKFYCKTSPSGSYTMLYDETDEALRTKLVTTVVSAAPGTYWCYLVAYNASGEGPQSNEVRFKVE